MTKFEYEQAIQELLDQACSELSPMCFKVLLSNVECMIDDFEDSND